jgi:hypothetical protein
MARYAPLLWVTLAGMALGYILVHPFALLAYMLTPQQPQVVLDSSLLGRQLHLAFSRDMLVMGAAFAFMGAWPAFKRPATSATGKRR